LSFWNRTSGDVQKILVRHISHVLKRDIGADDPLIDQFNINRLLVFINTFYEETGLELDVNSFFFWGTIRDLAQAIEQDRYRDLPKLIPLKPGAKERPLILFAGGVSCFMEMKWLLEGLDHDGAIYGMCLSRFDRPTSDPATVTHEVAVCCDELARSDLTGPVSLLGYSFGGIVALELARHLRQSGSHVAFLGMIDTNQSEHAWPLPVWLGVVSRKLLTRFQKTGAAMRAAQTAPQLDSTVQQKRKKRTLVQRLNPILFRFYNPKSENYPEKAPEFVDGHPPVYDHLGRQLLRMRGMYRPRYYDGHVVFYRATGGLPHRCDARKIWPRYLPNAHWIDVRGNHISAIYGKNGIALGRDVGKRLKSMHIHRQTLPGETSTQQSQSLPFLL